MIQLPNGYLEARRWKGGTPAPPIDPLSCDRDSNHMSARSAHLNLIRLATLGLGCIGAPSTVMPLEAQKIGGKPGPRVRIEKFKEFSRVAIDLLHSTSNSSTLG